MPLLDNADRCCRLAREIIGGPLDAALLRLAEFESAASQPLPAEPPYRAAAWQHAMPIEEHAPGESAPTNGTYELLNPLGTPAGTRVEVQAGQALPPARFGWSWELRPDAAARE